MMRGAAKLSPEIMEARFEVLKGKKKPCQKKNFLYGKIILQSKGEIDIYR